MPPKRIVQKSEAHLRKPRTHVQLGTVRRSVEVDPVERARAKRKLSERRATGFTNLEELRELSLIADKDIEILEEDVNVLTDAPLDDEEEAGRKKCNEEEGRESELNGEVSSPRQSLRVGRARRAFRTSLYEHLQDEKQLPCPHDEDDWCTCERRLAGLISTFVDRRQPPYTIWHAGTDFVAPTEPTYDESGELLLVPVEVFNMTGENGFCAQITNYGARIVSILMADSEGIVEEIMLSFPNMSNLQLNEDHYLYGLLGRVAGRAADGVLEGKNLSAQLELNGGQHHVNGGAEDAGFDRVVWQAAVAGNELVFTLLSPDGAGGYPGSALLTARYCVRPPNTLVFRLTATCTKPCPFLPALRLPFNLAGHGSGKLGMMEHVVKMNASHYMPTNEEDIVKGKVRHVAGSIYDLRVPRLMSKLHPLAPWPGYRAFFRLDGAAEQPSGGDAPRPGEADDEDEPLPFAAKLYHPDSRRAVELRTNQPVLYLATVRPSLPVDPEDEEEEQQRKWDEMMREKALKEATAAAEAAVAAAEVAVASLEDDGEGSSSEEETAVKDSLADRKTRFGSNRIQVMEQLGEETPPPTPVQGRGSFLYYRCCAVTLQPQGEPMCAPRRRRDGKEPHTDVSKATLRPGRQLLYALTLRFHLEEQLPKPRRQRGPPVRLAGSREREQDARARFDECDVDAEAAEWRRAQAQSWAAHGVGGSSSSLLPRRQEDLQADRCSVESMLRAGPGRYDRIFLGPPTAEVPEPQRRQMPGVTASSPGSAGAPQAPPPTRRSLGSVMRLKSLQKEQRVENNKEEDKKQDTPMIVLKCPRRPFGFSPA